jgi:hypothetical protein
MCDRRTFRPVPQEASRRVEKVQGTLMKCVGELERCKGLLHELEKREEKE